MAETVEITKNHKLLSYATMYRVHTFRPYLPNQKKKEKQHSTE